MTTLFSPSRLVALSPPRPLASSSKLAALLLTVGGSLALAGSASAQQFKVTATGTITNIRINSEISPFDSSVVIGTPFTVSYLFDYSVPNTNPDLAFGSYRLFGVNYGATAAIGDYKLTPTISTISDVELQNHLNGTAQDHLELDSFFGTFVGPNNSSRPGESALSLVDDTGLLLSSNALPPPSAYGAFDLTLPNSSRFDAYIFGSDGVRSSAQGTITSLSAELVAPAAVPEVSTWVSLGVLLGLGGLMVVVRRRRMVAGK